MALRCCRAIFPEVGAAEWQVTGIDAPSTTGYCRIDLSHRTTALDFPFLLGRDRLEEYGPFVRVTNSYNGQRALAFDIGYCRKVCMNGLIVGKSIISFKFTHSRQQIGQGIRFDIDHERLASLKKNMGAMFTALRDCVVPRSQFAALVRGTLLLRPPKSINSDKKMAEEWASLVKHLEGVESHYLNDLGETAYAAFNAITDIASHPPNNRCIYRDKHCMQRLAGNWVSAFSKQCRQPAFNLQKYLDTLATTEPPTKQYDPSKRREAEAPVA
jgi:hypothetical protein